MSISWGVLNISVAMSFSSFMFTARRHAWYECSASVWQENIRIQNNIHRCRVKHDTALFLRHKYEMILQALKEVQLTTGSPTDTSGGFIAVSVRACMMKRIILLISRHYNITKIYFLKYLAVDDNKIRPMKLLSQLDSCCSHSCNTAAKPETKTEIYIWLLGRIAAIASDSGLLLYTNGVTRSVVCLSVGHVREPWNDRDAVWLADFGGPRKHY